MASKSSVTSLEAKLVVLGSQGVGKTSFVHRYVKNAFIPSNKAQSTVGASFLTTRVNDSESGTTIRLQIWDTAGQERFRSISRLYYRGANAAILCYDVTNEQSFDEMGVWLKELRENCGNDSEGDMIVHIVGTKSDIVATEPQTREVPFERCIGYVTEQVYHGNTINMPTPSVQACNRPPNADLPKPPSTLPFAQLNPSLDRLSDLGGQDPIWNCCHEISAKDGKGVDEVFRVVTRKLVEQHTRRMEKQRLIESSRGRTPGPDGSGAVSGGGPLGYFDLPSGGTGSFRVGHGDKRRSWLGSLATPGALSSFGGTAEGDDETTKELTKKQCC